MDYEKKYNEALERVKKFHTPDSNNSNLKAVLEQIFPELRESEYERIKNKSGYYKAGKFWKASTLWNAVKDKSPQRVPNRYILQECTWNISSLQHFADEVKNVQEVDLNYPIILDMNGNILDGAHRVVKAYLEGKDIDIVCLGDDEWPEPDYDEEKAVKESEDERIRKSLVRLVEQFMADERKEKTLAYLEKQKYDRMKPIYDARESFESALEKAWNDYHNGYENVDKLEDDYVEFAHAKGFREGYLFGIEKQKEQKDYRKLYEDIAKSKWFKRAYDGKSLGCDDEQKEQKPNSTEDMPYITDEHFYEREPVDSFKYKLAEYMTKCCTKKEGTYGYTYGISAEAILKMAKEELLKRGELKEQKPAETETIISCDGHCEECPCFNAGRKSEREENNPAEWSEEDKLTVDSAIFWLERRLLSEKAEDISTDSCPLSMRKTIERLKYLHPQPRKEIYQSAKRDLAVKFMNYLDENRPEGKMSLSNGECKDIDKAFKENDWSKIIRYIEKYQPHWKPSTEQMNGLKFFLDYHRSQRNAGTTNWREYDTVESLYEQLKKLKHKGVTWMDGILK